jgi:hypothetical protein
MTATGDLHQPLYKFELAHELARWQLPVGRRKRRSSVTDDEVMQWTKGDVRRRRRPEPSTIHAWPRLMRAEHAAAYCGEKSVCTFRRAIGTLYPRPIKVPGKGERWLREALDQAIDWLSGKHDHRTLSERLADQ